MNQHLRWLPCASLLAASLFASCADLRDEPMTPEEVFGASADSYAVQESIEFASRADGLQYGLPSPGGATIAQLSALLPTERIGRDVPDLFISAGTSVSTTECQGGAPAQLDELPMVLEGVVTLHPRQYVKRPVCGQDERNYGSFVLEDDSGGILMLRNSRIANFSFGDRIRVTVRAAGVTAGDPETRAIVAGDIEVLGVRGPVLYAPIDVGFDASHIGRTVQVEGWVALEATNDNFNAMFLTDRPIAPLGPVEMSAVCRDNCTGQCRRQCVSGGNAVCLNVVCPSICSNNDNVFVADDLPGACWETSIDQELGRRRFRPEFGTHLRVTGPVVSSFGRKIWIQRIGQVEFL
jgi:hypothetical protein